MPLGRLAHSEKGTPWHQWLFSQERERLRPWCDALPELLVFFLREDVTQTGLGVIACQMLAEKFAILAVEQLSDEQIARVMWRLRGANWFDDQGTTAIRPTTLVIGYDFDPITDGMVLAALNMKRDCNASLPVTNGNVFHKNEVLRRLRKVAKNGRPLRGIDGNENVYEALHMLRAACGSDSDNERMIRRLIGEVAEQRPEISLCPAA